jgi:hypothetical protein
MQLNAATLKPKLIAYRDNYAVADTDTVVKKSSVSAGISYGSDALFFGRTGPIKYPFMSADMIFNAKPGFFIYGSALKVLGYKHWLMKLILAVVIIIGYQKNSPVQ